MRSVNFGPAIIAVCLVASTSCSDSTAPSGVRSQAIPSTPPLVTVGGMLHLASSPSDHLLMTGADGGQLVLVGATGELENLDNAELEVTGTRNADTLIVNDFLVKRVGGVDVMDGVLTILYDDELQTNLAGYGIILTGGSQIPLRNPPQALLAFVGARIWITKPVEGELTAFGVIGPAIAPY